MHGNLAELPLPDGSVDVVVNFQVIEHLWDQAQFVRECVRVLRPSGLLMVSTPNRITFSPGRDTPINPFHTRELNAAELTELLRRRRLRVGCRCSGVFHGPRLAEMDARHGGSIIDAQIARARRRRTLARRPAGRCRFGPHRRLRPRRGRDERATYRREPGPGGDRGAAVTRPRAPVPGLFTLVLHTHLPWLAHHGRWPVGEEWLYQSWAAAYLPLMRVLRTLAAEDRHRLITLGVTPVVTAQLDDPYCLDGMQHWLANWQLRAAGGGHVPPVTTDGYRSHRNRCARSGFANTPKPGRRSTTSARSGGTAAARCCAS